MPRNTKGQKIFNQLELQYAWDKAYVRRVYYSGVEIPEQCLREPVDTKTIIEALQNCRDNFVAYMNKQIQIVNKITQ